MNLIRGSCQKTWVGCRLEVMMISDLLPNLGQIQNAGEKYTTVDAPF